MRTHTLLITIAVTVLATFMITSLVSCKPSASPRAQEGLKWVNKFYTKYQIRGGWFFFGAEARGDNVIVFINVPETQAVQLKALADDQQINLITRNACPPLGEEIWSILDVTGDVIIQSRMDGNAFAEISCKTKKKGATP